MAKNQGQGSMIKQPELTPKRPPFGMAHLEYELPQTASISSLGFNDTGYWQAVVRFFVDILGEDPNVESLFEDYDHLTQSGA